jgi:hypothetical protein
MLFYRLLADVVVIVHAAYVLFVIFGLVAVLVGYLRRWEWVRNRTFRLVHLAMILLVVAEAWCGVVCPLTVWEQRLRALAGQTTYQGDFFPNLVHELLFYDAPTWVFTILYTLFGAAVAATLALVPPRWSSRTTDNRE